MFIFSILFVQIKADQGFVPQSLNWLIIDWADIFQVRAYPRKIKTGRFVMPKWFRGGQEFLNIWNFYKIYIF